MFPQVFGKFVLEGELSSGGMARVFLATLRGAVGFEKRLVVKQIRPELANDARFVERFVSEAKTSVELTHPNIAPVYELGVEAGIYYIAMEFCPGVTLGELFLHEGALPSDEVAYLGVELARALGYAHRRAGIVHRDVTPRNVLVDDEGAVRLIDFGIAAPVAAASDADREVFGTPGHMPPEQIRGESLGPGADVFALAALLYEALEGRPAFRRASEEESLRAVFASPAPLACQGGQRPHWEALFAACFACEPDERIKDMDEVGRALRELLREANVDDLARQLGRRVRRVRRASLTEQERAQLLESLDERERAGTRRQDPGDGGRVTAPLSNPSVESALSRTFATRPLPQGPPLQGSSLQGLPLQGPSHGTGESPASGAAAREIGTTPATRSSGAVARGEPPRVRSTSRPLVRGGILFGLCVALGTAFWARSRESERERSNVAGVALPPGAAEAPHGMKGAAADLPSPGPSHPVSTPPEPQPAPGPSSGAAPRLVVPSLPSEGSMLGPRASDPRAERGIVALTAAPSAEVSIAGRKLKTPVTRLELPPGTYRATFRSPTWDGEISVSVQVDPSEPRSVHADFTTEPPRLVVH